MTDFPVSHSTSASSTGTTIATFPKLSALFRTACSALAQATARNAQRRAMRRAPDEILMAHARREEARRAVERLMLLR
jgi:hypothetical protein